MKESYRNARKSPGNDSRREWSLLWWGVLDKVDALLNVALQTLGADFKQFLLLLSDFSKDVDSFLRASGLYIALAFYVEDEKVVEYFYLLQAPPESKRSQRQFPWRWRRRPRCRANRRR